jgi:hypothetical protein
VFYIFDVPNKYFKNIFKNVMMFPSLESFGQEHKFETCFGFSFCKIIIYVTFDGILFDFLKLTHWINLI